MASRAEDPLARDALHGPKKRPHDGPSAAGHEHSIDELAQEPSSKRSRHAGWPLPSEESVKQDHSMPTSMGPPAIVNTSTLPIDDHMDMMGRPSRFLEGSMNDRVSQKPPSLFTRDDEAMRRYVEDQENPWQATFDGDDFKPRRSSHPSARLKRTTHDGSSSARRSGIFKFGKSLANTINPVSIWDSLVQIWRETNDEYEARQAHANKANVMKERQTKAERVYAEMKRNGQFGVRGSAPLQSTSVLPSMAYKDADEGPQPHLKRDSGIDMGDSRSSNERKRDGRVFGHHGDSVLSEDVYEKRQPLDADGRQSLRSSFNISTPSLLCMKKARSDVNLPSTNVRSGESSGEQSRHSTERVVRKQLSRKDLQKQQRLSKRVSDLETKLEIARKELERIQGEPIEGEGPETAPTTQESHYRKPFMPGALPTLLSEGILFHAETRNAAESKSEAEVDAEASKMSIDPIAEHAETEPSRADHPEADNGVSISREPVEDKGDPSTNRSTKVPQKRKNHGRGASEPFLGEDDEGRAVPDIASQPSNGSRTSRARKSLKKNQTDSPSANERVGPESTSQRKLPGHFQQETVTSKPQVIIDATSHQEESHDNSDLAPNGSDTIFVSAKTRNISSLSHADENAPPPLLGKPLSTTTRKSSGDPSKTSKIPRQRRARNSPPPSSSISSLLPPKRSLAHPRFAPAAEVLDGQGTFSGSVVLTPGLHPSGEVPPVPKMPRGMERIVQLASQEIRTEKEAAEGNVGDGREAGDISWEDAGLDVDVPLEKTAEKPKRSRRSGKAVEGFEWPADVF
ncbi:MAG: hypothetical protein M1817_005214 [Caeruleum heppii]|nr:MAG: hypothetical protein M1817_005214 [Caeruleum heppii]